MPRRKKSKPVDPCVICLDRPTTRAHIACCDHVFCLTCILQWAERTNTCPLCKGRFTEVLRFRGAHVIDRVPVTPRDPEESFVDSSEGSYAADSLEESNATSARDSDSTYDPNQCESTQSRDAWTSSYSPSQESEEELGTPSEESESLSSESRARMESEVLSDSE